MPKADEVIQKQNEKPPPHPAAVNDAVTLAYADATNQTIFNRPFIRYIWIRDGEYETAQALSFAANVLGRGTIIARPGPITKENVLLVRVDARHYAPKENDLKEWLEFWEDFQFDPKFSFLISKATLQLAIATFPDWKGKGTVVEEILVDTDTTYEQQGKSVKGRWQRTAKLREINFAEVKDIDLIRIPNPELANLLGLIELVGSHAPIVSSDYFIGRGLSTIQDKGLYSIIYGGRYYQFAGIKRGAKKGTDEDVLLEQLGVGNVEKGITAAKVFDDLRSDQRVAIFRSGVTGSPRRIDFFRTLTGRIDFASGLISFTHDLRTQDIDIDTHPIANLLDFKDAAREVIWERPNGLHGYALFNGQGKLQDEAPPDVAKDHTIPAPHTARLQCAIGCISCHEAEGSDGWKRVTNDVKAMLAGKIGLDIFTDRSKGNTSLEDVLDRLAGLYQGDPEKALGRGRDDYAGAVLKATGPWKASRQGQTDAAKYNGAKVVSIWRSYFYDTVGPHQALQELGVACKKEDALKVLQDVLRPNLKAATVGPDGQAIYLEDPRIGALRAGVEINRFDWDLVFSFAHNRMLQNLKLQKTGMLKMRDAEWYAGLAA